MRKNENAVERNERSYELCHLCEHDRRPFLSILIIKVQ